MQVSATPTTAQPSGGDQTILAQLLAFRNRTNNIITLNVSLTGLMKHAKPFTLPRGKIDPADEDHDASAIAFKAPLPKASDTPADPSADFVPNPTSKIGRRQWKDDNADPWEFNAWDNVEWNEEQQKFAEDATMKQAANPVPHDMKVKFNEAPAEFWETFYATRKDTFFKDRAWLRNEFPILEQAVRPDYGPIRIAELGCGVSFRSQTYVHTSRETRLSQSWLPIRTQSYSSMRWIIRRKQLNS
ncbi:hypothetical protein PtA15_1A442 [Puccinia triticina]|uniref:Uncharacterized protein n=1 Tax=Puccinia triticina TaxID=208348 RepID=A0ABY7C7I3_9BASI|nr:uncharacterized protein PtA15_1A442 [Puccinia triticina]WAQ81104.1 hypothetical protein PtA15_1A442 [Puccinia triticina]